MKERVLKLNFKNTAFTSRLLEYSGWHLHEHPLAVPWPLQSGGMVHSLGDQGTGGCTMKGERDSEGGADRGMGDVKGGGCVITRGGEGYSIL
jgi:hypothetical protein